MNEALSNTHSTPRPINQDKYIYIYIYIYIYMHVYMHYLHTIAIFTLVHHHNGFMANNALDHIHAHGWVFK